MAKSRSTFGKLERDRRKKMKAQMKQERRAERAESEPDEEELDLTGEGELTAAELLEMVEEIHRRREAGTMTQEDFEDAKAELFARLPID
ncbi:MAG: hypothetical protein KDB21_11495 [Acidimicrobiales bacterium]|nr:hypothetical protein [Acidimicrobiales bacterium]